MQCIFCGRCRLQRPTNVSQVNCTEELLAIPHLFQALKRRFPGSHVRLLVLVDHQESFAESHIRNAIHIRIMSKFMLDCATQDVASNAVAKDLGNDVIFASANGSVPWPKGKVWKSVLVECLCVPCLHVGFTIHATF